MTEQKKLDFPFEGRKKRIRYFTCDVCGHTWRSYGYGQMVKCPKCYEQRTGKKLGRSPEELAEARAKKATKKAAALPDEVGEPPISTPAPQSEAKKPGFFDFLNKEIF